MNKHRDSQRKQDDQPQPAPAPGPYVATFTPQAWVNDYAIDVDPEGETTWDCSAFLANEYAPLLPEIDADLSEGGEWLDDHDILKEDPSAPQWVREWQGPFCITVARGDPEPPTSRPQVFSMTQPPEPNTALPLHQPGTDFALGEKALALLREVGPGGLSTDAFENWHSRARALLEERDETGPVLTIVTLSEIELGSDEPPPPGDIVEEIACLLKDAGFRRIESRILSSFSDEYSIDPRGR